MGTQENYLKLVNVSRTFFRWKENEYSVFDALAEVFNQWILQYVETVQNVDISIWSTHHRWNIINDVLKAGLLELVERDEDTLKLVECGSHAEEKASVLSEQVEEKTSAS